MCIGALTLNNENDVTNLLNQEENLIFSDMEIYIFHSKISNFACQQKSSCG